MNTLVYLPTSPLLNLMIILMPMSMLMLSFRMWIKSKKFKAGSQVMNTLAKMKSKGRKASKEHAKELIRAEVRIKERDNFNLTARRMGLDITYEDNLRRRTTVLVPSLLIGVTGASIAISISSLSDILMAVILLITMMVSLGVLAKYEILFMVKKKALHNDMTKDLSRLVTMYMYSDSKRGIHGAIQDFISDATALRVDLEMFLADLNSFEQGDALDRMGDRVPILEMKSFISYAKSANTMTPEQVTFSLMTLNTEIKDVVNNIMKKEIKTKFNVAMGLVLVCFTASLFVFMAPQIAEIDLSLF